MVLTCLKVFWLWKDNSVQDTKQGNGRKGRQKKRWQDKIVDRDGHSSSTRAAEVRTRWKELVVKSSVVPHRPHKVMG